MLPTLLFIVYLVTGTWLVHHIVRKKIYPFAFWQTASIVAFKLILGCAYGYIFLRFYHGDDTWDLFNQSLGSTETLIHYPFSFLDECKPSRVAVMSGPRLGDMALFYYYHLENWVMVKGFAILNLISDRNYYVDLLLFDLALLAGPYGLLKIFLQSGFARKRLLVICLFFIPSITFWLSGIRADGLLLLFTVISIRAGVRYITKKRLGPLLLMLFSVLVCAMFRLPYTALLVPALCAYLLSLKRPERSARVFLILYGCLTGLFFSSLFFPDNYQWSRPILRAQHGFFALHGNTRFNLDTLVPGPAAMVKILPQAIVNPLLRPYIWEAKGPLQIATALETGLVGLALLYLIIRRNRAERAKQSPIIFFCLFFALPLLLLEGMVVPFPGALVRYRAIPILFLLLGLLFLISANKKSPHNSHNGII